MRSQLILTVIAGTLLVPSPRSFAENSASKGLRPVPTRVRVVALGDSITKGVRAGVGPEETFTSVAERALGADGLDVEIVNVGVGGECTDQALKRLESVFELRPRLVTVMYGTNDSHVDLGATGSRLPLEAFRQNLKAIVTALLLHGIEPILMTEPRWADDAAPDGLGESPNTRLAGYMDASREVAAECRVPLVEHFGAWTEARSVGQSVKAWTTDGCHPNSEGHRVLAKALLPALYEALRPGPRVVGLRTQLDTVLTHDDGRFLWYHPRAVSFPSKRREAPPEILMTLQKHLSTSDHYSGLHDLFSLDLGRKWKGPRPIPELDWVHEPLGIDVAVADVTPIFVPPTRKILAVGAQVRYSARGEQLQDVPRAHQTAYAVHDPESGRWTSWRRIEMPADPSFEFARSACAQGIVEPNGTVLLPFYIGRSADAPYSVTVVRCNFDGERLAYREHGSILALDVARGLYEPSLARVGDRYLLTLRNDLKGYVSSGVDGLHYRPVKPWTFDDGEELGSYNTQQHWLKYGDVPFLVYTRKGANNDHIERHRAPLFLAQVDPERLTVVRATERILIPERGAELGNFGAAAITELESWVTVSEGVWSDAARRRGAKGALFVARVLWSDSTKVPSLPKTRTALERGQPVRVVCFGDSVTGVYYHTGSRRAYADMLAIALRRTFPRADSMTINAGISGHTTRDGLARIDRDVLAHRPTLVTVMFGLNDMTRVPLDEYRRNLAEIVAKCRSAGAEVLLCTPNNVINTSDRPSTRLEDYCDAVRSEGRRLGVPVCDVFAALAILKGRDPMNWRTLMSDEIHPNMDGHKRMAELLAAAITGRPIDLMAVPPPTPLLARTGRRLAAGEVVRVLAMPPFDEWIGPALRSTAPGARVEVTRWPTERKSLAALEQEARERVRTMAPDLVVLAVPRSARAESLESFIHGQAWVMNHSLSFGPGGWDCLVVHPSVADPGQDTTDGRDALVRKLVHAQDLTLIDRAAGENRSPKEILDDWIRRQPWR